MAKSCPNPKHPDFKALVSQYGELNAYKLYYKNNSKIPTTQEVKEIKRLDPKVMTKFIFEGVELSTNEQSELFEGLKYYFIKNLVNNLSSLDDFSNLLDDTLSTSKFQQVYQEALLDMVSMFDGTNPRHMEIASAISRDFPTSFLADYFKFTYPEDSDHANLILNTFKVKIANLFKFKEGDEDTSLELQSSIEEVRDNWNTESLEQNRKDSFSRAIKLLISGIPKLSKQNLLDNPTEYSVDDFNNAILSDNLNLESPIAQSEVNDLLLNVFVNQPADINAFMRVIKNERKTNPTIEWLHQKVFYPEQFIFDDKGNVLSLKDNNESNLPRISLINKFISSFSNTKYEFINQVINGDEIKSQNADTNNMQNRMLKEWSGQLDIAFTENKSKIINTLNDKYSSEEEILKAIGFPLASKGVITSKKKIKVLAGSKTFFEVYATFLGEFKTFIKNGGNPIDIFQQVGKEPSRINVLATAMIEFNAPYRNDYDNQLANVSGNNVSSINLNTYQTLVINNLNRVVDLVRDELGYDGVDADTFKDVYLKRLNEIYPEILNSWSYDSIWLNKYLAKGTKITMSLIAGTTANNDGLPTSKLVESDLWSSFLNNTLENNFPAIKHADRSMFPSYSFGYGVTDIFSDIASNYTPTSNWRSIFKGYLHDYFVSELKRVRKTRGDYKAYIENYDTLGQEFLVFNGILDTFKKDASHQARLEALINSDELDFTGNNFVNKQMDSWINDYFAKTKAESRLAGINELTPGAGLNKTVISNLTESFKSKPDTFEFYDEAIELAAAKFFVGAVEQSKLFLGDPAFYKIKGFTNNLNNARQVTAEESILIYDFVKRANMQSSTKQVMIVDNLTNSYLENLFNTPDYKIKLKDGEEFFYRKRFDGTLTELVIDDPRVVAHIREELAKIYQNDPESFEAYFPKGGFEETDGYSLGNIFFAAESIFRTEGISSSRLEVVKKELKALSANSQEELYGLYEIPESFDTPEKINNYMKNVIRPFTQQKYQYVGPNYMMSKENYAQQDPETRTGVISNRKNSYGMLIPSLIRGTILEDLNIFMLKNGIDTIHFASASKVGAPIRASNTRRLFYTPTIVDGQIVGFEGFNNEPLLPGDMGTLDYRYLGKQNEIAFEIKTKATDSTQGRKTILSGIMEDGERPIDFNGSPEQWASLSDLDKLNQSKLWNNAVEYESIYFELVDQLTVELLNEYNTTEGTNSLTINNGAKFANLIRRAAVERGSPDNILEAITDWVNDEGGLKYIESLSNYPKIQYILTSLVTNNLLILKRNGTMLAQAPSTGWESGNREASNGKAVGGASLNFYTFEFDADGNITKVNPAECALPFPIEKLPGLLKKYNTRDIIKAIDLLNADLLKKPGEEGHIPPIIVKGLRIPNQQFSSNDVLQVKKFLYPMYTQTILVPNEIIVKTGGDFDIDKESLFLPFLDDNFNTISSDKLEGTKKLQARLLEVEIEMLLNPARISRFLKPITGGDIQKLAQIEQKKTLGTDNSVNKPFTDIFKIGSLVKSTLEYVGGKQGVGIVATWITFHKIMETYNKSLKDGTKFSITSVQIGNYVQEVEDVLSALITSQVDIVKDSYSAVVNIVLDTLNPVCYMVLQGYSVSDIISVVNSPVIREYYRLRSKSNAKSISVKRGLSKKEDIIKYLSKEFPNEQNELYTWIAIEDSANKITDVKTVLSADTKYQKSPSDVQALETLYKEITGENGIFSKETIDDLMNNSLLTPFIKSRGLISEWFDQLYLTKSTKRMRDLTEDLRDKAFKHIRNKEANSKARQRFDENLINYLIQNTKNNTQFKGKFDTLFKGDNSIARRILKAKKNPAFENNYLINQLVAQLDNKLGINENEKIDNLKLYAGQLTDSEANSLAQAFADIKKIDENLYDDLIVFNIFQSGISNSTYQFNKVLPYEAQKKVLDFIATMDVKSITNKVLADFYIKFFLANPNQINKKPKVGNIFSPFKKDFSTGKLVILINGVNSEIIGPIGGFNAIDYTRPLTGEVANKAAEIEEYLNGYEVRNTMERITGKVAEVSSSGTTTQRKTYSGKIESLEPNQIFVFGSNPLGINGNPAKGTGGAALVAYNIAGVKQGEKMDNKLSDSGKAWGMTTVTAPGKPLSKTPTQITEGITKLFEYAKQNPAMEFLIADYSGRNLNGYTGQQMANMFNAAGSIPSNIVFNEKFNKLIPAQSQATTSTEDKKAEIESLREQEQAEYAAMPDPNDEVERGRIYDAYNKILTPLLNEVKAEEEGRSQSDTFYNLKDFTNEEKVIILDNMIAKKMSADKNNALIQIEAQLLKDRKLTIEFLKSCLT